MRFLVLLLFISQCSKIVGQINLVPNSGFETYTSCPTAGGQWNCCSNWNNVNMNPGAGSWGTPDYFNTCGTGGTAPPATFAGTCNPHLGNSMMALVLYNVPYPQYREYLSVPLISPMQPGNTYTLSFWLTNGTGIKSPWTIKNIGVNFSASPLSQTGWGIITATPQCEILSNIIATTWTQYTFTIVPTSTWNYLTLGAFRIDALNNPTMSFPNPGGAPSSYANYFVDDVQVLYNNCLITPTISIASTSLNKCSAGSPLTLTATGANNYTWTPSTTLSSQTGSLVTANPSLTTIYNVTGSTGSCVGTNSIQITVIPTPTILINSSQSNICFGQIATLSANGATSYTWMPGNFTGNTLTVSPLTSTVYTVTGLNGASCVSTSTLSVQVNPNPTLVISASAQTICAGGSATLSALGAGSYLWLPGFFNSTSVVVTPSATTNYSLAGSNAFGCTSNTNVLITVEQLPNLILSPLGATACIGSQVTFSATGANTYTWYPGNMSGSVVLVNTPSINTVYTVVAKSNFGCSNSANLNLTVVANPTVTAILSPSNICAGTTVTLSSFGATTYSWFPSNLSGPTVTVNPGATTIYTVVGNTNGCSSSATTQVNNAINPVIFSSGNINCTNVNTQLQVSSNSSTYNIVWSGPGIIGSTSNSFITVNAPGIYSVLVTDPFNSCTGIATVSVSSSIGPLNFSITPSSTVACYPGPSINLLINSAANYTWTSLAPLSSSVGPVVSTNPSVTTTYYVSGVLGVCSGSAAVTISVNSTPNIVVIASRSIVCSGSSLNLSASGAGIYFWTPGNLAGSSVNVSPMVNTTYTVVGANGNCLSQSQINVTITPNPSLTASASASVICAGTTLSVQAFGATSYTWLPGNLSNSLQIINPLASVVYTVVGANVQGCSTIVTLPVFVEPTYSLQGASSNQTICAGESLTMSVTGGTNYTWLPINQTASIVVVSPGTSITYSVYAGNKTCSNLIQFPVTVNNCNGTILGLSNFAENPQMTQGSFYKINFTVQVANTSKSDLIKVSLINDLKRTFPYPCDFSFLSRPRIISNNSALVINDEFDGISNLDLTSELSSTLKANKVDTIVYSLLLEPKGFYGLTKNTVIANASQLNGILVSDSSNNGFLWDPDLDGNPGNNNIPSPIQIELLDLFIPQGFSPNDDGINDVFEIKGLNGRELNITVYNRWGNKVFEKEGYSNNWDGRTNVSGLKIGNNKLPQGTYYYVVQFVSGNKETYSGFIVLQY